MDIYFQGKNQLKGQTQPALPMAQDYKNDLSETDKKYIIQDVYSNTKSFYKLYYETNK